MNLKQIPFDQSVLLDANVLLYANQRASLQCVGLMERCARREVTGIIPAHILAEVMHGLMVAEAKDAGWVQGSQPARQLAAKPEMVKRLNRYEGYMRDLLSIGIKLEPIQREDFLTAMGLQRKYGLMTNDALLLAVGERLRVTALVSNDSGFKEARGFIQYSPDDLEA